MRPPARMNLRRPAEVEDREVQELNIVAGDFERDLLEAAFAAPDANDVPIDAEAYRLLAKKFPVLAPVVAPAVVPVRVAAAIGHLLGADVEYAAAVEIVARRRLQTA